MYVVLSDHDIAIYLLYICYISYHDVAAYLGTEVIELTKILNLPFLKSVLLYDEFCVYVQFLRYHDIANN